jgi:crotonobetainyl-CoA:carnitine CoA-transferase CaiB-like acyl-CoA transferase
VAFPLEGLRVLDLSRIVAGPYAGRLMADLGADVVKLEGPEGDMARIWGEQRHGLSGFYTQQNAGKRNVGVDLKASGGADLVLRLAATADVVIENFRPGVIDRLGLGWDVLHAANPRVVLLSVTGFGQTGPNAGRQAFAPVVHAEAGLISRQAFFDDAPPTDPILSIADTNAAMHGLIAVLSAIYMRERTGRGQHVDIAMFDAMLATDDYSHHALDTFPVRRLGGEVWDAAGGAVMIAGEFRNTWVVLRAYVDDPAPPDADLAEKARLRRQAVGTWLRSFPDRASLITALEKANLAWGDVNTAEEAFATRQASARDLVAEVDDRDGGIRRVVQAPYKFSAADSGVRGPATHRGEHNAEVLADWLGMTPGEVADLTESGVLLTA